MTASPILNVRGLARRFGAVVAVEDFNLDVPSGAFVVLVGPSGCGKTTVLRLLAGLEEATAGSLTAGGRDLAHTPPAERGMGMVFQSYALFPNMSVAENIAFGLPRSLPRPARQARVAELLDVVGLPGLERRRPDQLSGGQQQRVAMARALAPSPATLLLDEPLSALDPHSRERLRLELKALQRRLGVTTIMVTHDQAEALALADLIVVMRQGRIEQAGAPEAVYGRPVNPFVAGFLGTINLWPATVAGERTASLAGGGRISVDSRPFSAGDPVLVGVRPESLMCDQVSAGGLAAVIEASEFRGALARLTGRLSGGVEVMADVPAEVARGLVGRAVSLRVAPGQARLFPAEMAR